MLVKRQAAQQGSIGLPQQSPWYTTGAIPAKSFNQTHPLERGVKLDAKGARGKPFWTAMPQWADGEPIALEAGDQTATYLYRTIQCKEATRLTAGFGSDDGIAVWLNRKRIHANDAARLVTPDEDHVLLDLKAGTNELLVKIYNRSGGCGFCYSLGATPSSLVEQLRDSYPNEVRWFKQYFPNQPGWFNQTGDTALEQRGIKALLARLKNPQPQQSQLEELVKHQTPGTDAAWLTLFAATADRVESMPRAVAGLKAINFAAMRMSIENLAARYPNKYPHGAAHLARLAELEKGGPAFEKAVADKDDLAAAEYVRACEELRRTALVLENPAVNFDRMLLIKRDAATLGLPANWQANSSVNPRLENEIDEMDLRNPATLKRVYQPAEPWFVGDMNLHWDGDRLLFSSIGKNGRWQVFEMKTDGSGLSQVTPGESPDIDNFNGIYLPDGRIIFDCNGTFLGVPCVGGADYVANLHLLSADRKTVRRLCFEQDNDWYPTVMPDGRIMYLRWEYTDSAHYFSRILMTMNPDGTNQVEYYHSNSYWPNSNFYAKPVPGCSTRFVGVISGHHGSARMGELVLFDVGRGRQENTGAVQRIPGYGKPVEDIIKDGLVDASWPKFLHPIPLDDKYVLVSCKPGPNDNWGIYLVDVFDNVVLLREEPGFALLEPIPLRKTPTPPAIPDKVNLADPSATVTIQDIYSGPGLRGVPRGTVKSLRLFQYEYSYRNMGGHYVVGLEGPWDVRRIIGTVPVESDGSAHFVIPANTPVSLQPLDAEGKALQQKRSWFVGMPGEQVSCNGCHNMQNTATQLKPGLASLRPPVRPTPWYGPRRGFSFLREVQPVLDKYCVGCHDGKEKGRPNLAETAITRTTMGGSFPQSYIDLHPYIRRNGPEGDYHLLTPLEFHADTSDLVQMLSKGHHNVKLDREAWDRLITWIDLNVPAHGTWHEAGGIPSNFQQRRYEMKKEYANVDEDIEQITAPYQRTEKFIQPEPMPPKPAPVAVEGWPIPAEKARQMQAALGNPSARIDLGGGRAVELRRIPAGQFEMGDLSGYPDEYPTAKVRIDRPFWMAVTEISLEQYQQFDPQHRNGYYDMHYKDQVKPGYLMDSPNFPVIRVSWHEARAFCRWLSEKTGKHVTLPTEAQWEWACRAGSASPMSYGDLDTDFSKFANLGDRSLKLLAVQGVNPQPIPNPDKFWDFVPKDDRFDDGVLHLANVGSYESNVWGLKDMHGNVSEWTRSTYRPYPYDAGLEGKDPADTERCTVRGGSWYDRPIHARCGFRQAYPAWQKVYNVGIRIIVEE
jgi:formylglycine-generating enzyme required for sulfatase activity